MATGDDTSAAMSRTFADLGLPEPLLAALDARGYASPTPVQAAAIEPLTAGRDLVVQAPTGTGKTAAYGLPLLARLERQRKVVQALVLAPTRELAQQVTTMLEAYGAQLDGLGIATLYGGHPFAAQIEALRAGPQVVVATPGRLMEHVRRHTLSLDHVHYAVIDEADEMLRMGFLEDVEWILDQAASSKDGRQTALFSATIPLAIRRVAKNHFKSPKFIGTGSLTADTIEERAVLVPEGEKVEALMRLLDAEPITSALVFARTQQSVAELAATLERHGFRVEPFHGGMSQGHRERVVAKLRAGHVDIVVATDVAARGLDFEHLSHVVVFDAPKDPELWVHRAGRTGRSGRSGHAILLYTKRDTKRVKGIEMYTRKRLVRAALPTAAEAAEAREARLKRRVRAVLAAAAAQDDGRGDPTLARYERVLADVVAEGDIAPLTVAAALAKLLHGERPLQDTEDIVRASAAGMSGGKRPKRGPRIDPDKPLKRRGSAGRGRKA